jgi:hypothetical protein
MFMVVILVVLIVGLLGYFYIGYAKKQINDVRPGQHFTFEGMKFSTQEFYALTESLVKDKAIPDVKLSRINHSTKGILSAKREYLRVVYHEYFFDICAAPFAKDFFVSWRQGDLRQVFGSKRREKTFYEQDTELMFKESIKLCVNRAIEQVTEAQGIRVTEESDLKVLN